MTESEGDERAVRVLTAFRTLLRKIARGEAYGSPSGSGDGAMLVGVEPTPPPAATPRPALAIECAETPSERFAVRTGISAGEVILLEGDHYIGHPVNVAARLADQAEGGQLLADATLVSALPKRAPTIGARWPCAGSSDPLGGDSRDAGRSKGTPYPTRCAGYRSAPRWPRLSPSTPWATRSWFCADSCRDTWERRPAPPSDEFGSLRTPLL